LKSLGFYLDFPDQVKAAPNHGIKRFIMRKIVESGISREIKKNQNVIFAGEEINQ